MPDSNRSYSWNILNQLKEDDELVVLTVVSYDESVTEPDGPAYSSAGQRLFRQPKAKP
jgi:hypothetical protein